MKYKLSQYLIAAMVLVLSFGCSSLTEVDKPPQETSLMSVEENTLVLGRVRWIENGETKYNPAVKLRVLRIEDMKEDDIQVGKDGRFLTYLPEGTYIIYQINWFDLWDGPHWLRPSTAFQILEGQQNHYLGTLIMEMQTKRDVIGKLKIKEFKVLVEDEGDDEEIFIHNHYPDYEGPLNKQLMIHDSGIPRNIEREKQQTLLDITRALFFGVMPMLSP